MPDDEWDAARARRSVPEIERLELERLEHAKAAMREAKAFIRDFVATDKRLLRQIRRLVGYLDANGIWPTHDPDEIAVEDLIAPWEDAVNMAEPVNDPRELLQLIEEAEREYEEERREREEDDEYEDEDGSPLEDDE